MKIIATFFGKTKCVEATPHNMGVDDIPDRIIWVERQEDWYALSSPQLRDLKVAVVDGKDWRFAEEII